MKIHDALMGLIFFVIGLIICYVAKDFPDQNDGKPGPWLFPVVLSLMFSACGLILSIKGFRNRNNESLISFNKDLSFGATLKIIFVVALILFYVFAAESLGFLITMEIVILSLMLILQTKPLPAVIVSTCATVGIYLIFAKALLVPLPEGLFYF